MFEGDVEELSLISSKWVELEHCVSLAFQSVESKSPLPRAADCGDQVKQVYASFSKFSKNTEKVGTFVFKKEAQGRVRPVRVLPGKAMRS